jgi:Ribbon-helix-helix protein, copG family
VTRICHAHDPDDAIADRICGGPIPCPLHPNERGSTFRSVVPVTITLGHDALRRLDEMARRSGRNRSAQIAELVRAAEMPRARRGGAP